MKVKLTLLLVLLLFVGLNNNANAGIPFLQLSKNESILLNKDAWKFYFGHTYEDICKDKSLVGQDVLLPDSWKKHGCPAKGYGTYILKFRHDLPLNELVTLHLLTIGSNFDLFINGTKFNSVGKFSVDANKAISDFKPGLHSFEIVKDTVEIVLQVSNYEYRTGGIWFPPSIGKHNAVELNYLKAIFLDSFLCGALLIMFVYFLAFYFVKKDQKTSLMFAILCLFAAIRIATTGEVLFRQMGVSLPWEILVKLEYLSIAMMLLFGYLYLINFFSLDANKKIARFIIIIQSILGLFYIFAPVSISSEIIPYFLIFCSFVLAYILVLILQLFIQKRALVFYVGGTFIFVFIAAINDVLYSQLLINSYYILPLGVFVFALVQAIAITRLFSTAFKEVENLSAELLYTNKHQQEIILDRTSMLNAQAGELMRSNKIKDKVFSIIAHDLRTPINSLGTLLHWVAEDDLSLEDTKKSLASIGKNVDTLNLTLENLLNWSLNQLNDVKSESELIDLRTPLQEIAELFKVPFEEKSVHFQSFLTTRAAVYMDKNHLNLLLRNLISNALKFSNIGGTIEVAAINYEHNYTLVSIKDNGVGMNAAAMAKVFSTEEHLTTYGTNNEKGTGLGLLLCKEYIEKSSGKIWIESEIGKGTIVFFTLPNFPI